DPESVEEPPGDQQSEAEPEERHDRERRPAETQTPAEEPPHEQCDEVRDDERDRQREGELDQERILRHWSASAECADAGEREADERAATAFHLRREGIGCRFLRRQPRHLERILTGLA